MDPPAFPLVQVVQYDLTSSSAGESDDQRGCSFIYSSAALPELTIAPPVLSPQPSPPPPHSQEPPDCQLALRFPTPDSPELQKQSLHDADRSAEQENVPETERARGVEISGQRRISLASAVKIERAELVQLSSDEESAAGPSPKRQRIQEPVAASRPASEAYAVKLSQLP